ncbi:Fungal hypothetical protein [Teratosphaeria destructans]|uniref:DUF1746 domain-containing protein n=1 Tax=Teratosphaeria destructans TaxID=418781 RepID=A0A9W7SXY9_9PEZI|nr:Fungal hypothetical protein [Teratosphaeria destructans]
MSDEPSSSSAARAAASSSVNPIDDGHDAASTQSRTAERRKKNRQMFNRKRGELLDDLLQQIDMNVYAFLSCIYYMDCSFLRFFLRASVQFVFLTPKPSIFPEPKANRPFIGGILGTNLLCLLLHAIFSAPAAGEATRGYLHGGLILDLIGQKGPSSKSHLLLLDLLIVFLQVWQLSTHLTRQRLKESGTEMSVTTSEGRQYAAARVSQDLDHEERGVQRADIEMQTLNAASSTVGTTAESDESGASSSHETLLATTAPRSDQHIFDAFHSGQIVLADLDLVRTVREQFLAYQHVPREPLQSSRELRANIAGQLLRLRFGANVGAPAQRILG